MNKMVITCALTGAETTKAQAPALPVPPEIELPASPPQPVTVKDLKKQQNKALADLKKKLEEGIEQLKESMKGKSWREINKAVNDQRKIDLEAVKTLKAAQKAELEQFKIDHPETGKPGPEAKAENNRINAK